MSNNIGRENSWGFVAGVIFLVIALVVVFGDPILDALYIPKPAPEPHNMLQVIWSGPVPIFAFIALMLIIAFLLLNRKKK